MKKILAAGISLAVLSLVAPAAMAAPINAADVKGKITFFTHWSSYLSAGLFDKWEAEFKALYPGIEDVDVQAFQDYDGTMGTRLAAGDYGDVLDIPGTGVSKEDLPQFFATIDDLDIVKDFYYTDNWNQDGHQYALTYGLGADGIVYNKAAFAKAGVDKVPTTWTEFLAAANKLKAAGTIPIILNMGAGWPVSAYDGLGVAISGDPNFQNVVVTDPSPYDADKPMGKSFGILKKLITDGLAEPDLTTVNWEDSKGWLASGKGAMWFLGNWSINQVIDEGSVKAGVAKDAANIGFFPFP
jgi:raffinose/stachyose/melibiose transport system substrate-binding protein